MKIYLGGKMDGRHRGGNWRDSIVTSKKFDVDFGEYGDEYGDGGGVNIFAACGSGEPPDKWPVLPKVIFDKHDYVGPYLVACDHGCYHSGDHASSIAWGPIEGIGDQPRWEEAQRKNRQQIAKLCLQAMSTADILFFWFEGLDAYGTAAELAFAYGAYSAANSISEKLKDTDIRGIKKHFFVASPSFDAIDEMWLAFTMARKATFITAPTPKEALATALASLEEPSSEDSADYSPIEKKFIDKWRTTYGNGITPQYNVPGFRYRVDFAFPTDKVAVELDGYEYHSSKEQFTNDRKRQREMELAGWRFIRFSGSEVYSNAEACVRQAYEFWQSCKKGE